MSSPLSSPSAPPSVRLNLVSDLQNYSSMGWRFICDSINLSISVIKLSDLARPFSLEYTAFMNTLSIFEMLYREIALSLIQ